MWKLEFRQNYRTNFSPTVPPFAARISRVVADVQAPGGESGASKGGGKQWQTTLQELAQDAVCYSHTGHMTELWFLPTYSILWLTLFFYDSHCIVSSTIYLVT